MNEPADNSAASSVGERLRAARNRQGMTLQKIAEDLHLDLGVLEAMEGNRFRALGAPVFARGHLRKYAQMLGLDVEALLSDYEAAHAGPAAPTLMPTSVGHTVIVEEQGQSRRATAVWIAVLLGASAIVGGLWWWHQRALRAAATAAVAAIATPVASNESAGSETAPVAADVPAATASVVTPGSPQKIAHPAEQPSATAQESAAAGAVARLRMRFSADSWVEIYDATGRRLMFDEESAGGARSVTGVPPLRVLLGNFAGVELTLDGRRVEVPEGSRTGATARFRVLPGGRTLSFWGS